MTGENSYVNVDDTEEHFSLIINVSEAIESMNTSMASLTGEVKPTEDPQYIAYLMQQLTLIRFLVQKILSPIVVSFGVVGNLLNIAVLTRRWMRSSTNYYLTALAVSDIFYLMFAFTLTLNHYPTIASTYAYTRYYYTFGRQLGDIWSNVSVWLTLTFTVERYIGVCHPMKGKRWCTPERARYIIVAVTLTAAVITFPEFFERKIVPLSEKGPNNSTIYRPQETEFGKTKSYQLGYVYMNQGLFTFMPLLLLSVFNSLLIRAVLHAAKKRKTMASKNDKSARQHKDQQRITIMLISVVIVFLICQLPQALQNVYLKYIVLSNRRTQVIMIKLTCSANIFNLLVMLNSSMNFVLYSSFSTKFRFTFKKMFCKCVNKRRNVPEILFSEVGTAHPSPTEDSRSRLLIRQPKTRDNKSSGAGRRGPTGDTGPRGLPQGPIRGQGAQKSRNGYLEVNQNSDV